MRWVSFIRIASLESDNSFCVLDCAEKCASCVQTLKPFFAQFAVPNASSTSDWGNFSEWSNSNSSPELEIVSLHHFLLLARVSRRQLHDNFYLYCLPALIWRAILFHFTKPYWRSNQRFTIGFPGKEQWNTNDPEEHMGQRIVVPSLNLRGTCF